MRELILQKIPQNGIPYLQQNDVAYTKQHIIWLLHSVSYWNKYELLKVKETIKPQCLSLNLY